MPSSTSSSDSALRPIPSLPWRGCLGLATILTVLGLLGSEVYWRAERFEPAYRNSEDVLRAHVERLLGDVADGVRMIRARGGEVAFVRPPASGPLLEAERAAFPRERTWNVLLEAPRTAGVHFEDDPDLQGFGPPEWSHIRASETPRFTRHLLQHLRDAPARRGPPRAELGNAPAPSGGQTAAMEAAT